jgi:hypothetical protein
LKFTSHASPGFWSLYDRLPLEIQKLAAKQYELFAGDPYHPSLRLKPIGPFWSARVSRSYRALATRRGDHFFWFWIGSHADYDNLIGSL